MLYDDYYDVSVLCKYHYYYDASVEYDYYYNVRCNC